MRKGRGVRAHWGRKGIPGPPAIVSVTQEPHLTVISNREVIIRGKNFGPSPAVLFGNQEAETVGVRDDEIRFVAPTGVNRGLVAVYADGGSTVTREEFQLFVFPLPN